MSVCGSIVQPKCESLLRHLQQLYPGSLTTETSAAGNTNVALMWHGTQTFPNLLCVVNSQLHIKRQKLAVLLHEFCGMPFGAITDPLSIPPGSLRKMPFRSRELP